MVKMVWLGVVTVVVLGSVRAATQATPNAPTTDLSGVYECEGTNPDGSPYAAVVEIAKAKDAYYVRWNLADDTRVIGIGILSGGVLGVSYFTGAPSVVVYTATSDGLEGKWTSPGAQGSVFSEKLTKVSAQDARPLKPEPRSTPKPDRKPDPKPRIRA
jgi:hypothetical protein